VQFAEIDLSFDCLPRMVRADSVAALYEATRGWGIIDHNLVAGDIDGTIGHRSARASLAESARPGVADARLDRRYDWQGWIAHEDMPCVIDPPGG